MADEDEIISDEELRERVDALRPCQRPDLVGLRALHTWVTRLTYRMFALDEERGSNPILPMFISITRDGDLLVVARNPDESGPSSSVEAHREMLDVHRAVVAMHGGAAVVTFSSVGGDGATLEESRDSEHGVCNFTVSQDGKRAAVSNVAHKSCKIMNRLLPADGPPIPLYAGGGDAWALASDPQSLFPDQAFRDSHAYGVNSLFVPDWILVVSPLYVSRNLVDGCLPNEAPPRIMRMIELALRTRWSQRMPEADFDEVDNAISNMLKAGILRRGSKPTIREGLMELLQGQGDPKAVEGAMERLVREAGGEIESVDIGPATLKIGHVGGEGVPKEVKEALAKAIGKAVAELGEQGVLPRGGFVKKLTVERDLKAGTRTFKVPGPSEQS